MPCSHASGSVKDSGDGSGGLDRRNFMKSALAIGGTAALSTSMSLYGLTGTADAGSRIAQSARDNRQHAWGDYLATDPRGLAAPPAHHSLLFLNYSKSGEPTAADRVEMEEALQQLETAFDWSNEGLLFTVNYSLDYFDRFDESLPSGVDLRPDQDVIDAIKVGDEDPTPESHELFIDLASDNATNILAAEDALWGERDFLNGVAIDATFEGIFERPTSYPSRRTGFVGPGEPREHIGDDDIHEDAPLSLGFQSVFSDNIPSEDDVTMLHNQTLVNPMPPGVYAQGTIQHASVLDIDIDPWYDQDFEDRVQKMYSPHHTPEDTGPVGNDLGTTSGLDDLPMRDRTADDDIARRTQTDAETKGVVGHTQKLARARFDLSERDTDGQSDGVDDTTILRRDFNTTDVGKSGLHFLALMRFNGYMVYVRQAMNGVGFDSDTAIAGDDDGLLNHDDVDIPLSNDGFLDFITSLRRGNFVVPPLTMRSLPVPQGTEFTMDVEPAGDADIVDLDDDYTAVAIVNTESDATVDPLAVYFGPPEDTNKLQSAEPVASDRVDYDDDGDFDTILYFRTDDLGFDLSDDEARMLIVDENWEPYYAESSVEVVS